MSSRTGKLVVLCGPPGVGKGSILRRLGSTASLDWKRVVSVTTRPAMFGEVDGVDYHFVTEETFSKLKMEGALLGGLQRQFGFRYGIIRAEVDAARRDGCTAIMESNLLGVELAKRTFLDVVAIFLLPPSKRELVRRMVSRQRDDRRGCCQRLRTGLQMLRDIDGYQIDYRITNDSIESCVAAVIAVLVSLADERT